MHSLQNRNYNLITSTISNTVISKQAILFNIYTNDQPLHNGTRNFVYADDICVTAQYPSFTGVEHTIEEALDELTTYYSFNSLRANSDKTQFMSFHLKIREAKRTLEFKWNNTDLENTPHPRYIGVTLDRTLSYKNHIHNTNMKVATRNNLLKTLSNSKWDCNASTIRTTALACEYACPVWARSPHTSKLDLELNDACQSITGCLRPTNVEELYLFARIVPPDIRRDVCEWKRRNRKQTQPTLYTARFQQRRLKRECFLSSVRPADFPAKVIHCIEWHHTTALSTWMKV